MTKVLIVDDNEQNLYLLQVLLKGHGCEVVSARNGAEALEKARRDPPDVIISDILMPVMDGFTLCREWKKDETLKAIPFVFYTATYTGPKDEKLALSLGAERFIIKPAEPDVFMEIVQEVLKNHEAGRLVAPREPVAEEVVYFKQYNEALIRKLEAKMMQLEEANRAMGLEIAERTRAEWMLGERVKELTCLYAVNHDMREQLSVDELCRRVVEHLVPTMQFPEITVPVIELDDRRFTSERYTEGLSHGLHAEIRVGGEARGRLSVYYAEDSPFLIPEEQNLLNIIGEDLGLWLEHKRAEERIEHLNAVLRAIRGVNQLIVKEKDRDRLLQGACDTLIKTRGYYSAWIVLLDEASGLVTTAEAGVGKDFLALIERLKRGELTACGRKALKQPDVVAIKDPLSTCADCPLSDKHGSKRAMTARLECDGKVYGLLTVSTPIDFIADEEEEQALFQEVAEDIAFALRSMELEEERKRAEEALRASEAKHRTLLENLPQNIFFKDRNSVYLACNENYARDLGITLEKIAGKTDYDFYPKDLAEKYRSDDERIVASGRTEDIEERYIVGGQESWVQTVKTPIKDKEENTIGVLGIFWDITERKRNDAINASRLHLLQFATACSIDELLEETLNEAEKLTGSLIGFYHFVEDDQTSLTLQNWSTRTKAEFCKAEGKGLHYAIDEAGVWVDCVYQRKAVIHNDYASLPHRKGVPEGYAEVIRQLVVPVIRGEKITAILGVGNKPTDYTEQDIETVSPLADLAWEIAVRKRAEEELAEERNLLRTVIDNIPDLVYAKDTESRFVIGNIAVARVMGAATPDELLGKRDFDFYPQELAEQYYADEQEIIRSGVLLVNQEEPFMNQATGGQGWLSTTKVPLRDSRGEIIATVGVGRDITERKQAEEELRKHREHLEELVTERTQDLDESRKAALSLMQDANQQRIRAEGALSKLQEVNQELNDFAYVVSHDLKAPLRAATQLAGWIATDYAEALGKEGQEMVNLLTGRTRRMHNLIQGILEYSRIGRVKEREKEVDLNWLVQDTIEMLSPPEHIQMTIKSELPTVVGEHIRLEQVFQNLLGNAIKFMDKPAGYVVIDCADEGANWLLSVADNGPGIEEKYHDKVFQMFQTLAPRDELESTGVGLALVKKIVETTGGSIWLESEVGKGSTFYFTLPKEGEKNEGN